LEHLTIIWYILWPFGQHILWQFNINFYILEYCTKKICMATMTIAKPPAAKNTWTGQGCQIFIRATYQNNEKYTKMTIKYSKWPQNIPNVGKLD
jgi:hypothetical protein